MKQLVSKLWALILGLLVLLLAVVILQLAVRNHLDQETDLDHFEQLTQVREFTFFPKHDGINIVVLRLKNPGLTNVDPYEFQIELDKVLLTTQKFSGVNAGDPSDLRIQFAPLVSTLGKQLSIKIVPLAKSTQPLQIGISKNGGLSRQLFYRGGPNQELFSHLNDLWFLLLWGGTIVVLMYV